MPETEKIVVGYNDSDTSNAALAWAIDHARATSAEVVLVFVLSSAWEWELSAVQVDPDPIRHRYHELLDGEWSQPLRDAGVAYRTQLLVGRPAEAIMRCAQDEQADLIVVGMSSHSALADLMFGSAAHKLEKEAHRPVVAVPPDWRA